MSDCMYEYMNERMHELMIEWIHERKKCKNWMNELMTGTRARRQMIKRTSSANSSASCLHRAQQHRASQRSLHNAPIFRLLLKVAVNGTHQCDFQNFCGALAPNIFTLVWSIILNILIIITMVTVRMLVIVIVMAMNHDVSDESSCPRGHCRSISLLRGTLQNTIFRS